MVLKHVTLDEGLHALVDGLLVFNRHSQVQELLGTIVLMGTRLTDDLICVHATEMVMDSFLLLSSLDRVLKFVQENTQVLFNVHLLDHVHGVAVPVFERVAVSFRVDVHLF